MRVSQLCDGAICDGESEQCKVVNCVTELWRPGYGASRPCKSVNCMTVQCAMVKVNNAKQSIVSLSYRGQGMVLVDHASQSMVQWCK
jgi:hypothetical protein